MEFEKVSYDLELDQANTTENRDNLGEIEHGIRVFKKRGRHFIMNIPFESQHKKIVVHLVYFVLLWLNVFLTTQGISEK